MDSDGLLPTASQTKQGQALGRSWCTCNADPSPYNPTPGLAEAAPGLSSPLPSDWLGCAVGTDCSLDWSPGKGIPLPITGWKTLQAAGAGVAAPHFCPPFHLLVFPPEMSPQGDTLPQPVGREHPSPCSEGFKNYLNEFLPRQMPPPPHRRPQSLTAGTAR